MPLNSSESESCSVLPTLRLTKFSSSVLPALRLQLRGERRMSSNSANLVDVHVGGRLRMRRREMKMTQEQVGIALSLTFQQVQK